MVKCLFENLAEINERKAVNMSDDSNPFPKAWRFHSDTGDADGTVFRGRFTGVIEAGETRDYGTKPVARFIQEDTDTEYSIWLFQQALLDRVVKIAPEKGELIVIEYLGKKKSKTSSRTYASFRVTAPERLVEILTWDSLAVHDEEDED